MKIVRKSPSRVVRQRFQHGVALLEALLAVVLLAIGLMGTLVLQARSLSVLSEAGMRAEATIAANELVGMVNTDPVNATAYAVALGATPGPLLTVWHTELLKRIPGAKVEVVIGQAPNTTSTQVDIAVLWQRTPDSQANVQRITSYVSSAQ